jgi:hypothetical protein
MMGGTIAFLRSAVLKELRRNPKLVRIATPEPGSAIERRHCNAVSVDSGLGAPALQSARLNDIRFARCQAELTHI